MSLFSLRVNFRFSILIAAGIGLPTIASLGQTPVPLQNPGFEEGLSGWNPSPQDSAAGLSSVTPDAMHAGANGLQVKQDETGLGSWIQSAKAPIDSGKAYQLKFWARCVQTSGIGVWVNFFDSDGHNMAVPNANQLALPIPQDAKDWTEYKLAMTTPAGASTVAISVHAYSKHACLADFDDFSIVPADVTTAASPSPAPATAATGPTPLPALDSARVTEIASFLDPKAQGIGPSIDDRKAWDALGADANFQTHLLKMAERFLNEPTPEISDELWKASAQTSNRTAEPLITQRRFRLANWVLAEGVENKGRFLPAIEKEIAAICAERTWVLPAHDQQMLNFNGTQQMIDLGVGMTSWTLANADSMLGSHLSDATRKLIRDETRRRVIVPYLAETHGETHIEWWRTHNFNWNAVVHAGVVGTAMTLDDSVPERAEIIASVEKEIPFYLAGFPADGYSTEGMDYWKYGFGHYIMLSEAILNATYGKVNLYASEKARLVAQFPRRFEVAPGVYPAYADSHFDEEASVWLYHIIDCRYGLGDRVPKTISVDGMFSCFLYAYGTSMTFDSSAPPLYTEGVTAIKGHQIRDWFEDSQVLVDRLPEGASGLTMSFKGGTNGASHGHIDVGTYVVAMEGQPLLVDPGSTNYGVTTFTSHRFDNEVLNSYGHSVPKAAGQLESNGVDHFSTIADKSFTDAADSVTLDLTKAFAVPTLKQLTRRFDYSRADKGKVTITDAATFASPQDLGTALITYGEATEEKPGVWTIAQNGKKIRVEISAGDLPFTVTNEVLKDESRVGKVRRLGINLNAPATTATITVTVTPAAEVLTQATK